MDICETLENEGVDLSDLSTYALGYLDAESKYRRMIETGELVEVVRCKDCKECEIVEVSNDYWCKGQKVWKDHYCAYGERRSEPMGDIIRCKSCVWYDKGVCLKRLDPKTPNSCCPEWMPKERRKG